jgi:hypothetical protein
MSRFMKRRIRLFIGFLAVFTMGVALGHLLSRPIRVPDSGGQMPPSPNERLYASAFTWTDSSLLGHDRTYSEFLIQTSFPDSRVIRSVKIEDSAQSSPQTIIDWREDGHIQWATNSSAVTFSYDGPETSIQMTLKVQP